MARIGWLLLALLSAAHVSDAYKILLIFPLPAKSHCNLGDGVVRHLANAGHEITYVTPYPKKNVPSNIRQVDVSANLGLIPEDMINIKSILDGNTDSSNQAVLLFVMNHFAEKTVENGNVTKILDDPNEHFDLVIAEWLFTEVYAGIAPIFNAPLIWFSTIEPHWMILRLVDEYLNPSYNGYYVPTIPPFNFLDRISELFFTIRISLFQETVMYFVQNRVYNRVLVPYIEKRGRVAPSLQEVKYNASLVLGNSHVSLGQATRLPQIYKPIGGFHIDDNPKPLTEDLKKLMDESKDGVIYFSMGSNLKSKDLPNQLKRDLLQMFGSLKQTVLWKFEEVMPDLPKNVHILKWAPQQSILSHPNCLVFITHGGLLSTTETVHTGVPIIGIPVFADQFLNVERAVRKGYAMKVSLSYTMAGDLKKAIEEIISNPSYRQKIKELSFIYHDRPVAPGAELVHWVEHVVKTGGAPHLRSHALLVPWYQKIYLDLIILLIIGFYILKTVYKYVKPLVFGRKNDKKKRN